MSDGPVLAVSDTHFGFQDESAGNFKRFVAYLTTWMRDGDTTIEVTDANREKTSETLIAPRRIVLLGDIIDLWISRDSDTVRPYLQSFNPLSALIARSEEVAYVVGNHDWVTRKSAGRHQPDLGGATVTVYPDYYDPHGNGAAYPWKGERIGGRTYLFLHGHQFDFVFSRQSMLRFGDFMGFSSASASEFRKFSVLGALVFFVTLGLVFSPLVINWLPLLLRPLTTLAQHPVLAVGTLFAGWVAAVIASVGVLWMFNKLERRYYRASLHPRRARVTNGTPPTAQCKKTLQQLVGTYGFRRMEPHLNADVIVFGHTHEPCIDTYAPNDRPPKLLINTGSWVPQNGESDTFVYVDDRGPRLLQWHESGYVSQIGSSIM